VVEIDRDMNETLGEFEVLVLTGVLACGDDAYGMTVQEEVEALVGAERNVSIGAIYTTLGRLEEKGLLRSWFGDPTNERGGRAKKFYRLTAPGKRVLDIALEPMAKALRVVRQGAE
jgi:DNA-binding PadR family transcriptional regulator